ncbi:MAG: tRNA (N(6)-L-threonylcarbamoyladenosine(37)-C(2))-methylthiotransferase MtaB [Clostridia bacterium]|jgi:threonylcarbamoyladenosine tRNA methylthiotransferase MtaB|nr:tRNA (N(6)-L-threonylcarbamoyladenosine(37)-C(2))-methylthiotransferase MtaB [Clostridia bacterium]MDD3232064.1 tRNA (N(6)-L-threonylcarbamoyladenosine(37)-C(2))-methylthiotransferase MtaB [Clostridia bacterium]MDD4408350.1 tRNA (N(6)-L-threonylcarbamoyladenosine(37)-C(2))-methylthiotransferase MtaB [Clostridia bacterium]
MKIVIITLGCKVNQYESDALAEMLIKNKNEVSRNFEPADVYILNSCAVTNEAERKSRQMISKCLKLNPHAKVLVCGCASEKNAEQFENSENVIMISGTANKLKLIEKINEIDNEITSSEFADNKNKIKSKTEKDKSFKNNKTKQNIKRNISKVEKIPDFYENISISSSHNRRAFVKIQDGCNRFCSYCIIPYLRGRSRSRDIVSILSEVNNLIKGGVKEIVLTGIDISDYKIDNEFALIELLNQLNEFNVRLRLSSFEEGIINDDFLEKLSKISNFCPHFHMSLQSGSDSVLKRMNRKYTSHEFLNSIKKIRKHFKNCAITTDIIVGFPGETAKEFKQTLKFAKKAKFAFMHIFPFSRRSGTAVDKILTLGKDKRYFIIPSEILKKRVRSLHKINKKQSEKFCKNQIGKTHEIIVEERIGEYYVGHSRNFLKVYIEAGETDAGIINKIVNVEIKSVYKDGVIGEIVKLKKAI